MTTPLSTDVRCGRRRCGARLDTTGIADIWAAARAAGWQYQFAVGYQVSETDAGTSHITRCPDHPAHVLEYSTWEVSVTAHDQESLRQVRDRVEAVGVVALSPAVQEGAGWRMAVRCYPRASGQDALAAVQACGATGALYPASLVGWGPRAL